MIDHSLSVVEDSSLYADAMVWLLTGVAVPIFVAALSAFGATWFTNRQLAKRDKRHRDEEAADKIRAYIRALRNQSVFLEETEIARAEWDPTNTIIDPGGRDATIEAYKAAAPFFHRLRVGDGERQAVANSFPDLGNSAMDGSDNFARRADLLQRVLDRGFIDSNISNRKRKDGRGR